MITNTPPASEDLSIPCDLLLFGGTGDLALRKLLPALYRCHRSGTLHPDSRIVGISRQKMDAQRYREWISARASRFIPRFATITQTDWASFLDRLHFISCDVQQAGDFQALSTVLEADCERVTIAYLATSPQLFEEICANLAAIGLNHRHCRVVLEKPLGLDLQANRAINDAVARYFSEDQIFRIDHYQGKESVQNLLIMRFANVLFEPLWRREWISHVEISICETVGVGRRGAFYDRVGALRDMVQNHSVQLLCMIAMEPPVSMDAQSIREEKLKVLKSLRPFTSLNVMTDVIRGQYQSGAVDGKPVAGFHQEADIDVGSDTETFVALRTEVLNWRWAGVPFFLRTGKRLKKRLAEIVIHFREVPHQLFPVAETGAGNRLVIRLQPDDSIRLHMFSKQMGSAMIAQPREFNLDFLEQETPPGIRITAYQRLLTDVIRGDQALFVSREEQEIAWQWVAPIMATWEKSRSAPRQYPAGSDGPEAALDLLAKEGWHWYEGEV